MAAELVRENYHGAETVSRTEQAVLARWKELLELLERHRSSLGKLAHLMALLREADAVGNTLEEMKVCKSLIMKFIILLCYERCFFVLSYLLLKYNIFVVNVVKVKEISGSIPGRTAVAFSNIHTNKNLNTVV